MEEEGGREGERRAGTSFHVQTTSSTSRRLVPRPENDFENFPSRKTYFSVYKLYMDYNNKTVYGYNQILGNCFFLDVELVVWSFDKMMFFSVSIRIVGAIEQSQGGSTESSLVFATLLIHPVLNPGDVCLGIGPILFISEACLFAKT